MGQPITRVTPPFQPRKYPVGEGEVGCLGEGHALSGRQPQSVESPAAVSVAVDGKNGSSMGEKENCVKTEVFASSCEGHGEKSLLAKTTNHAPSMTAVHGSTVELDSVLGTKLAAVTEASSVNGTAGNPETRSAANTSGKAKEKQQVGVPVSVGKGTLNRAPTFHCPPKRLMKPTIEVRSMGIRKFQHFVFSIIL